MDFNYTFLPEEKYIVLSLENIYSYLGLTYR